ncbi:MAG: putative selenate ABC transporter substrate-binding protein [Planctomycetota bacterium]
MRIFCVALMALATLGCGDGAESSANADKVFKFSALPDQKLSEQSARFEPVAKYLSEALGMKVEYVPVTKYSASVQAFKTGDVHAAWFGGLTGVQARLAVEGAKAIAQGDADPNYFSYFIAHKDSGLTGGDNFPEAAKGKKFTFGSESSTSGRLMPEYFIRENTGDAPDKFFGAIGFSGTHTNTIAAVNSGSFDVGALSYKTYDKAAPEEKANTVVLWKTPFYADYNFTVRGDLDAEFGDGFTAKLTKAFLAMPGDLCEKSFLRGKMIPAKNSDFDNILATAEKLGLARK